MSKRPVGGVAATQKWRRAGMHRERPAPLVYVSDKCRAPSPVMKTHTSRPGAKVPRAGSKDGVDRVVLFDRKGQVHSQSPHA